MSKIVKRDEFLATEVKELALEVGYAECAVKEEVTDKIIVEVILDEEMEDKYACTLADGILEVEAGSINKKVSLTDRSFKKSDIEKQFVTITLPCAVRMEALELEVGAGEVKLKNASTAYGRVKLEVGAGKVSTDTLTVENHADIEVGAGNADIQNFTAKTADIECGVGKMTVKGAVENNINVECGVGNIEMYLDAVESDYNYDIDCALGSVVINGSKRGGLFAPTADMANADAKGTIKLECGVGKIELTTQKRLAAE